VNTPKKSLKLYKKIKCKTQVIITEFFCAKDSKPCQDGEKAKARVTGSNIYQISINVMPAYSLESKLLARVYFKDTSHTIYLTYLT
jgi:hypothetical protein